MACENYSLSERAQARLTHWVSPPFNVRKLRLWWYMLDNEAGLDRNALTTILNMWCVVEAYADEDHALVKELQDKEDEAITFIAGFFGMY